MVYFAPKEEQAETLDEFFQNVQNTAFVQYVVIILVISMAIICCLGPKYGNRYASVYITLCSAIGSLSVVASKGLGLAIKSHLTGNN